MTSTVTKPTLNLREELAKIPEFTPDKPLTIFQGGTSASDAVTARANLGLTLGTSGATVPLLNTANTWSAIQDFKNTADAASLGSELTTNGTFTGNATGWTLGAGWAYSSNNIVCTLSGSAEGTVTQNISVTSGNSYLITWDQTNSSANSATIQPSIGAVNGIAVCPPSTSLQSQAQMITAGASGSLALTFTVADSTSTGTITLDNISVKEITPIPANLTLTNNSGTTIFEQRIGSNANSVNLGTNAGKYAVTAGGSIAIGGNAGLSLNSGTHNVCIGSSTGKNITTGTSNILIGVNSGLNLTVGGYNVGFGRNSGSGVTTGSNNSFLGYTAGSNLTTGSNVTCIGYNAQPSSATVSNEITLGDANVTAVRIPGAASIAVNTEVSNWLVGFKVLQIGTTTFGSFGQNLHITNNSYYSNALSAHVYSTSAAAAHYQQTSVGTHAFNVASAGTAGNVITFKTALSIENNTDVRVGSAALATSATAGFPWIPSMAGTPTGTPTEPYDHATALTWDYTNKVLYANTDAAWTPVSLPADSQVGFRNKVINGDFQVWQRGTTFTDPTNNATAYCADRWQIVRQTFAAGITASKQTYTNNNSIRVQRNNGNTSTAALNFGHSFETIEVKRFAGKTMTLSFSALRGANYSATSNLLSVVVQNGTGTDSTIIVSGFTSTNTISNTTVTLGTSFARYTVTFTVPSNATQFGFYFQAAPTNTAGAADYYEITDVQLEEGSVATPFERRPYGLELSLCQRYYYEATGLVGVATSSSVIARATLKLPVTMRRIPDITIPNTTRFFDGTTLATITGASDLQSSTTEILQMHLTTNAVLTTNRTYIMLSEDSKIKASAEL